MSTHKHIDLICAVILAATLLITVLFMNGEALGIEAIVDEDAEAWSGSVYFTANDENADLYENAVRITLTGSSASVAGNGAYAYGSGVVIKNAGTYIVSGTLTDGSVTVDAYRSSKVFILLDGADVACSNAPAFYVKQADKVFLTLAEGSENFLASGDEYAKEALADGADGTVFAHDDLTINGSGALTVTADCKHGISVNDDLVITGGVIAVTAPEDGIRANDSLRIRQADISVTAGDDGLVANAAGTYLYVESGTFNITAKDDAVRSAGDITIDGGSFTLKAGNYGIHSDTAVYQNGGTIEASCFKKIEAPYTGTVPGGRF